MSVIVKTECQKCEDIHEDEVDGVLILAFKKQEDGSMAYPWWYHDMPLRQAVVGFIDYIKAELNSAAEDSDYEGKPYDLLIALIQEGKIDLAD
ncbi:unnamed protein product [marine sediment metagenome]|uniref:Uncharacterized protein n=1 Tax=marine sediment metagenome TaxID=412755 RepID=X0VXP7_9ZZZZ